MRGQTEVQTVKTSGNEELSGAFTLTSDGQTTAPLPFDASPFFVEQALGRLYAVPNVDARPHKIIAYNCRSLFVVVFDEFVVRCHAWMLGSTWMLVWKIARSLLILITFGKQGGSAGEVSNLFVVSFPKQHDYTYT